MSVTSPLAELVRLAEKATPGPWFKGSWSGQCHKPEHHRNHPGSRGDNPCVYEPYLSVDSVGIVAGTKEAQLNVVDTNYDELTLSDEDIAFMVAARNAIPALKSLLASNQGLQERIAAAEEMLELADKAYSGTSGFDRGIAELLGNDLHKYRRRFPKPQPPGRSS